MSALAEAFRARACWPRRRPPTADHVRLAIARARLADAAAGDHPWLRQLATRKMLQALR